jgi:hypothetical protein
LETARLIFTERCTDQSEAGRMLFVDTEVNRSDLIRFDTEILKSFQVVNLTFGN